MFREKEDGCLHKLSLTWLIGSGLWLRTESFHKLALVAKTIEDREIRLRFNIYLHHFLKFCRELPDDNFDL